MKNPLARVRGFGPPQLATLLGWMIVAIALATFVGWAFHLSVLIRITPGAGTMKANTALSFLIAGIALIRRNHREFRLYPLSLLLIAFLTALQAITKANFGIDELLFYDFTSRDYPGRMSEVAMAMFIALGTALLLLNSNRLILHRIAQSLGIVIGLVAGLALLGYAYDTHAPLIQIRPHNELAIMTAAAFVFSGAAIQLAFPSEGLTRLFWAQNAGGAMLRRMLPLGVLIPLLLGFAVRTELLRNNWEKGFALALASALTTGCLIVLIWLNAIDLEKDDLARRETEQRFRLVADAAPVMIWMSGLDKLCTFFNEPWLQFTGRTMQAELGNGWAEGVHPDDLKHCVATYTNSFERRETFQMQYRLRRHDGDYRWILDTGVPRFDQQGSFAGYIGSCIDMTERKQAEEALEDFERRMIQAQEQERSRIARELHDDINQRIAALGWELSSLDQRRADGEERRQKTLSSAIERLRRIGSDIQSISRRLHSSQLEFLGLAPAAEALCRELRASQQVEIDFECNDLPPDLPKDISLCIYRVLQEALQNGIKHSGARDFKVKLQQDQDSIHLCVIDQGTGFDLRAPGKQEGLGLTSMRERARLVNGECTVISTPGRGTTVTCRIPLGSYRPLSPESDWEGEE